MNREQIKDIKTIKDASVDELEQAKRDTHEQDDREVLRALRALRKNKAAEQKGAASYAETKTVEAIIKSIRAYRTKKENISDKIAAIKKDERYSSSYKAEKVKALRDELAAFGRDEASAARSLLSDIVSDRLEYDKAFFTDAARMDAANRIITVLKAAGKHLPLNDFINLISPIAGDPAAARYVAAAVKDDSVLYKGIIDSFAINTETAFDKSRFALDAFYSGMQDSFNAEKALLDEAASVGICLTVTDYMQPITSDARNTEMTAEFSEIDALNSVRRAMGVITDGKL